MGSVVEAPSLRTLMLGDLYYPYLCMLQDQKKKTVYFEGRINLIAGFVKRFEDKCVLSYFEAISVDNHTG